MSDRNEADPRIAELEAEQQDWRANRDGALAAIAQRNARIAALEAERDALVHDIERHLAITSEQATERDTLREALAEAREALALCRRNDDHNAPAPRVAIDDALAHIGRVLGEDGNAKD